jgi:hypothetical protein
MTTSGRRASRLAAAILFAAFGCGGDPEPPRGEWKTLDSLPQNFPADIPIYPQARVVTVVARGGGVAIWETTDALATVQQWYTQKMGERGWQVTAAPGMGPAWIGDPRVTVIGKDWGRRLSIGLGQNAGKTNIIATWHRK